GDVADEYHPLGLEAVVVGDVVRYGLPGRVEVDGLLLVRVPDRARGADARLHDAILQAGDRRAERAVDLEGDEVVAVGPRRPGHVDVGDDAALEEEGGVGRVVGGRLVGAAVLVDALGDVGRAEAGDRLHLAEEVVEHGATVADHVEAHAAAVLGAVVPGRALGGLPPIALEDPVAELAAHGEHAAEEAGVAQQAQL